MQLKSTIYNHLPNSIQPLAKNIYSSVNNQYRKYHPNKNTEEQLHSNFIQTFFDSQKEYQQYKNEFNQGPISNIRDEALEDYHHLTSEDDMGSINLETARDYYTIIRKTQPDTIVETGVCNGLSTLSILLALKKNENGHLYSIDYPFKTDESLREFREKTFNEYGGAAIPIDKEPGWIIPDELRDNWTLITGKSQQELPKLLPKIDKLDLFIHDSEHSYPCMMFEYELAYHWLKNDGILLSDDIAWNTAFNKFTNTRDAKYGQLSDDVGYIKTN